MYRQFRKLYPLRGAGTQNSEPCRSSAMSKLEILSERRHSLSRRIALSHAASGKSLNA